VIARRGASPLKWRMRWIVLAALCFAASASAAPPGLTPAPAEPVTPAEVVAGVPVAYYLLAITWTPEWRRINGLTSATSPPLDPETAPQGFALHGLWPNGKGPPYPRYCRPVGTIPAATVRRMHRRTPSAALLQHEWQAHGACADWNSPAAYFRDAARLYDRVRLPRIEGRGEVTAGDIRAAFVARNPIYPPSAVFVAADREGRFYEVRLCHDLAYAPAACPGGAGAADAQRLQLTPSTSRRF